MTPKRCSILLVLLGVLLSCVPASAQSKRTLNILCWSEYLPQSVVDDFSKQESIRILVQTYESNEELLEKLESGIFKPDLIQPSEHLLERLISQGRLEPLDHAAIPNLANVDPKYRGMPHDPDLKYSVPWMSGVVGIMVNLDRIATPIRDYADVFVEAHRGRIVALNDHRELITWALCAQGGDPNNFKLDDLASTRRLLASWAPLVRYFDSDNPGVALLNGDADLGILWSGQAAEILEETRSSLRPLRFEFVIPASGGHLFVDSLAIPKGAQNRDLAMRFINHTLDAPVAASIWKEFPYTSPNAAAKKLLTPQQLANPASFPADTGRTQTFRPMEPSLRNVLHTLASEFLDD